MEKNYNNDSNLIKFEYDGKTYSFQEAIKNKIVEYQEKDDISLLLNIGYSRFTISNSDTIVKFGKFKFVLNQGGKLLFDEKMKLKYLSDNHEISSDRCIKGKLEGQKIDIWNVEPCHENDQYLLVNTPDDETTIKGNQGQVFKGSTFIVDKKTGEIVDVKKTIDTACQQETNTEKNDIKNLDDSKKNEDKCCNIF